MFFLNLTLGEFAALLGTLGGVVTALYLLDRTRRRRLVSTLRFWRPEMALETRQAKPRVRQPWSLLLQLLSLLLLLLAIGQVQWGSREEKGRDHVLLVDTSSWSGERRAGKRTLLDDEKDAARQYVSGLRRTDRVMLVAADALATPLTPFTTDRERLLAALREISPSYSSLGILRALSFAREAQSWSEARKGEITYVGAGLTDDDPAGLDVTGVRLIKLEANRENCGIRSLSVTQSEDEPDSWQALIRLKNFGTQRHLVQLKVHYGTTPFADRTATLPPGREESLSYSFLARSPGDLVAEIQPGDVLTADDRASVHVPGNTRANIAVYTSRPEALKPLIETARRLTPHFYAPSQYSPATQPADVFLLDHFNPTTLPKTATLSMDPPADRSPLPVKATVAKASAIWNGAPNFGPALRAKPLRLSTAHAFQIFGEDVPLASVAEGPVVVERPASSSQPKLAIVGFDPLASDQRFQLSTPLLFADLVEWLSPNAFRNYAASAERIGEASVSLGRSEQGQSLEVLEANGLSLPFTRRGNQVEFFADHAATVRIVSQGQEHTVSMSIPDVASQSFAAPQNQTGLPPLARMLPRALDLWKWLACLAAVCLALEWLLWGGTRRLKRRTPDQGPVAEHSSSKERELVTK